jgi:tetratricopeptide (TPR) repeat protein
MNTIIVLLIIFVLAVGILAYLFLKKLPQIRIVNPGTSGEAKSKQLKHEIMRSRIERASGAQVKKIQKGFLKPLSDAAQDAIRTVAGKLTAVERSYQKRQKGAKKVSKDVLDAKVKEGRKFLDAEKWDRAEKTFIEVISADPKHVRAYEYLGKMYLLKKDYDAAKETLTYLKKLAPDDASVTAALGEVEAKLGHQQVALKHLAEAVKLNEKNPKYLDLLIGASIDAGDKKQARASLKQLKKVNPDNQKIAEFEKRLKA